MKDLYLLMNFDVEITRSDLVTVCFRDKEKEVPLNLLVRLER